MKTDLGAVPGGCLREDDGEEEGEEEAVPERRALQNKAGWTRLSW